MIILLLMLFLLCNSVNYNTKYKCPKKKYHLDYLRIYVLPGKNYAERVGLDTLNIKLDRDIPCGIYSVKTAYGNGIIFIGSPSSNVGYFFMTDTKYLEKINMFDVWDIKRLESDDNKFLLTYNRGCCD
jgi:hypothetical protein